jgi:polyadenylation factor subunit 2
MALNVRQQQQFDDDDDRPLGAQQTDRDFYRKNFTHFNSVTNYVDHRVDGSGIENWQVPQPHYSSLVDQLPTYGYRSNPADGVCMKFLKRGFTKPHRVIFNAAVWSADTRWLVLGTSLGDLALWEGESLKVHKIISVPAHKELHSDGERIKEHIPITSMAWKRYGNLMATGDNRGLIQFCDETYRNVFVTWNAHTAAVRGLSFSPLDTKLASCSDDSKVHIWTPGFDRPDHVLVGHQSEVKCVDWHPFRALIASGSRDSTVRLWDPRQAQCLSTITAHKRQVNCCQWNQNGNWLASGSTDGLIKIYDIRMMREMEVWRGQNSEVCRIAWHPIHETLMVSGGYNGSLVYWLCGQHQTPHSIIGDAHRQMIEMLAWHPGGYVLASASHDCLLKFWCREPPGSRLDPSIGEAQDNAPVYMHGPLPVGTGYVQVKQPVTFVNAEPRQDRDRGEGRGGRQDRIAVPSVIRNIPKSNYNAQRGGGGGGGGRPAGGGGSYYGNPSDNRKRKFEG